MVSGVVQSNHDVIELFCYKNINPQRYFSKMETYDLFLLPTETSAGESLSYDSEIRILHASSGMKSCSNMILASSSSRNTYSGISGRTSIQLFMLQKGQ